MRGDNDGVRGHTGGDMGRAHGETPLRTHDSPLPLFQSPLLAATGSADAPPGRACMTPPGSSATSATAAASGAFAADAATLAERHKPGAVTPSAPGQQGIKLSPRAMGGTLEGSASAPAPRVLEDFSEGMQADGKQWRGGVGGMERECPFQSGHPIRGSATNDVDLSDDYIRSFLKVEVSHESCNMIRTINKQLRILEQEGVVRYLRADGYDNCVWGFRVLEVKDPLRFNTSFRDMVPLGRDKRPLKRPTEVFMKTMRFCGVTARRGSRGPRATDPDPRDFMYSFYYDYISSKEEYNRRKLCMNGYSKEAREIAAERRGQFLERDHMPKRTKRSADDNKAEVLQTRPAIHAAAHAAAVGVQGKGATTSGLDALFAAAFKADSVDMVAGRARATLETEAATANVTVGTGGGGVAEGGEGTSVERGPLATGGKRSPENVPPPPAPSEVIVEAPPE